jgi:hypothetical protein
MNKSDYKNLVEHFEDELYAQVTERETKTHEFKVRLVFKSGVSADWDGALVLRLIDALANEIEADQLGNLGTDIVSVEVETDTVRLNQVRKACASIERQTKQIVITKEVA